MEPGKIEAREAVIRTIAMPSDTNPAGDIFGGWLMSQMDLQPATRPPAAPGVGV
jgi:acyl-CoA thioesterase YciA